jgi:hypothetical protein
MTQQELFDKCQPLLQREFSIGEVNQVLNRNQPMYWSWGVSKRINLFDKGYLLKVNGHHHKGWVLVRLSWDDTYSVYIISNKGEVLNEFHNVYWDMLADVIDDRIERINEYVI